MRSAFEQRERNLREFSDFASQLRAATSIEEVQSIMSERRANRGADEWSEDALLARPIAYIAGPLKSPNQTRCVRRALDCAEVAFAEGFAPFVPHMTMFWDVVHQHDEKEWMEWCMAYVRAAKRVYRVPGESRGADAEVKLAESLGITVVQYEPTDSADRGGSWRLRAQLARISGSRR